MTNVTRDRPNSRQPAERGKFPGPAARRRKLFRSVVFDERRFGANPSVPYLLSLLAAVAVTPAGAAQARPERAEEVVARRERPMAGGRVERLTTVRRALKYPLIGIREATPLKGAGASAASAPLEREEVVADHVIVRIRPGVSESQLRALTARLGMRLRKKLGAPRAYLVGLRVAGFDEVARARRVLASHHDIIELASEDRLVRTSESFSNDPLFAELWGLRNDGASGGTPDADIDATDAWSRNRCDRSVLVAVIDSGMDYDHADLAPNIWTNPGEIAGNGIDDDRNGFVDDVHGWDFYADDNDPSHEPYRTSNGTNEDVHGTHVAGTIGAVGNNGLGVVGVCWQVSIVPLRFIAPGGGFTSDAADAIHYATSLGVVASNNSWAGYFTNEALKYAIWEAQQAGVLFVTAAGNDGLTNDGGVLASFPAAYNFSNIIAVTANDHRDAKPRFANVGAWSVDLSAPGVDILSTVPDDGYARLSGTSMAAPHVTGVVAMLKSQRPWLSAADVKRILMRTGDPLPDQVGCPTVTPCNLSESRVNADRALTTQAIRPLLGDYNGDGRVEYGSLRFDSPLRWMLSSNSFNLGTASMSDQPIEADYDGDGRTDAIVFRPTSKMAWFVQTSRSGYTRSAKHSWGSADPSAVGLAADTDGDGRADLIAYHPGEPSRWEIRASSGSYQSSTFVSWGSASRGDVPLTADIDGDGKADLVAYRPGEPSTWYVATSTSSYRGYRTMSHGSRFAEVGPLAADFDGDGKDDLVAADRTYRGAAFDPITWKILTSASSYRTVMELRWGNDALGDELRAADRDGDGRADLIAFRPGRRSVWYGLLSSSGYTAWETVQGP